MSRRRKALQALEGTAKVDEAAEASPSRDSSTLSAPSRSGSCKPQKVFSLDEAKNLLELLRAATARPDFQGVLVNLRIRGWKAVEQREAVALFLGRSWKASPNVSGFNIEQFGFPEALAGIRTHQAERGIQMLSAEIEELLRLQPGDLFGSQGMVLKQTSGAAKAAAQGCAQLPMRQANRKRKALEEGPWKHRGSASSAVDDDSALLPWEAELVDSGCEVWVEMKREQNETPLQPMEAPGTTRPRQPTESPVSAPRQELMEVTRCSAQPPTKARPAVVQTSTRARQLRLTSARLAALGAINPCELACWTSTASNSASAGRKKPRVDTE